MMYPDAVAFIYEHHAAADEAVRTLSRAGFDMKQLSLVGKGYHSEDRPTGFYTAGDRIKAWGGAGAFWGGIWGLLLAPAVFVFPGIGVVAMAGPLVAALVGTLEGAVAVGGLSALSAALSQVGVPKHQILSYEMALRVDKYLLVVHGSAAEQARARAALDRTSSTAAP